MNHVLKAFAEEALYETGKEKNAHFPEWSPKFISANSRANNQEEGLVNVQIGKKVCYAFDFAKEGMKVEYEKMQTEAKKGILEGKDLLVGMLERYEHSEVKGNLAYLITQAQSYPSRVDDDDDSYDPY